MHRLLQLSLPLVVSSRLPSSLPSPPLPSPFPSAASYSPPPPTHPLSPLSHPPLGFTDLSNALVTRVLRTHLPANYSVALYGAPDRVPFERLQLLWLPLLSRRALHAIKALGGICLLHAKFLFPPFYSPHNPRLDPQGSVWIRRNYGRSYNTPIPSHSWAEVTHCGASSGRSQLQLDSETRRNQKFFWDVGPSWYYVAPGSGVSINVGRTVVLGWQAGTQAITKLYDELRSACGRNNTEVGNWRVRRSGSSNTTNAWSRSYPSIPLEELSVRSTNGVDLALFDSLQITGHKEYFSAERRHEIIMLHQPNCAELRDRVGEYKCGRHPWLRDCDGAETVERLTNCCSMTSCSNPLGLDPWGISGLGLQRYRCTSPYNTSHVRALFRSVERELHN